MDINSKDAVYEVAINMIPGLGSVGVRSIISQCGSAREFFENINELIEQKSISPKIKEAISDNNVMAMAEEQIKICEKHNINILSYQDRKFPRKLAACDGAPSLIYTLGQTNLDRMHTVGIVGTRSSDSDGRSNIFALVEQLKTDNINVAIISGLATGADTYAHQAALRYEIPTVAVLGHGLNMVYPSENRKLAADMIHAGGALVTEYYYGQPVLKTNFPRRNKIIAGLCDCIIVAQSKESGGALITANVAREYRREIFAFPGRISDKLYAGCNKLIAENKATLITSGEDLERQMGWTSRLKPVQTELNMDPLSDTEIKILDILNTEGSVNIDSLSMKTGIPIFQLSSALLDMEFKDLVTGLPGKRYEAK